MARFLKGRNWNELAFFPMWPRLIFLTGWIHPVRKFVFCLFSNNWFWYFRTVNDLEFGLHTILSCLYNKRISGRWVFILVPRQNLAHADYNSNPWRNLIKLWWSPSQHYHCFKKKDVCGFEQISDNLLLQIQDKRSKR